VATATDAALKPLVHLFLGKVANSLTDTPAHPLIPATLTHLPLPVLNTGQVGVCGRDVHQDGLCQLFPPLSCYLCPSFIAWRDGPHHELWASLNTIITAHPTGVDKRILLQLSTIQEAIGEVLQKIEAGEGGPGDVVDGQ
ncbi:MAG: hypothetical protein ACE5FD_01890, partial [Anaerolineae bacterium]